MAAKHHLKLVDSYEPMLADPEVEGVVPRPTSGHADQIVAAAQAGKHVFCEKPFVMSKADQPCRCGRESCRRALGLGYNRRFHPSWLDLKQRIAAGELGTILHAECAP